MSRVMGGQPGGYLTLESGAESELGRGGPGLWSARTGFRPPSR